MSQITYHICSRVLWNLNVWAILFPLYLDYGFLLLVLMGGAGSDEYKTLSYHHLMLVHLVSLETVTRTYAHMHTRAQQHTHTHTLPYHQSCSCTTQRKGSPSTHLLCIAMPTEANTLTHASDYSCSLELSSLFLSLIPSLHPSLSPTYHP